MILKLNDVDAEAETLIGFKLISVGTIWNDFYDETSINLYNDDGIHPNFEGTFLTSALFFKEIFNVSDINNSNYNGTLSSENADLIKDFVSNLF